MASIVLSDEDVQQMADRIAASLRAADPLAPPAHLAPAKLTPREEQVLRLLLAGALSKEIGSLLQMKTGTVNSHRLHILAKLGARNTTHLGWIAACMGYEPSKEVGDKKTMGMLPRQKRKRPALPQQDGP